MAAQDHNGREKAIADDGGAQPPTMSEADRRQVRVLTFIVVGLGVLLMAGLAVLVATVIMRASGKGGGAPAVVDMALNVPPGAVVEGMALDGNLLALRLRGGQGREVLVIDVRKGRVMRRIRLRAETE